MTHETPNKEREKMKTKKRILKEREREMIKIIGCCDQKDEHER